MIKRKKYQRIDLFSANPDLKFTHQLEDLSSVDVFIVTVPTPIDDAKKPDFGPLNKACETIGIALKLRYNNNSHELPIVIFESTVYPGATEEICVPIIEETSGLKSNRDFYGYSPERINPGDKQHTLVNIVKVTSGSNYDCSLWVDDLYGSIVKAGTFPAKSIRVAEAAKVIENTQRDINIALINELSLIFRRLNIDTSDVLKAASSKWNFLPFKPGLVGGHCIGLTLIILPSRLSRLVITHK